MAIVSYTYLSTPQADGRLAVVARFIDHLSAEHLREYDLPGDTNVPTYLDAQAFAVTQELISSERNQFVNDAINGQPPDTSKVKHETRDNVDRELVRTLLSLKPPIENTWLNSVDYLAGLTTQQIKTFAGVSDTRAVEIKAAITLLKRGVDDFRQYRPPLA